MLNFGIYRAVVTIQLRKEICSLSSTEDELFSERKLKRISLQPNMLLEISGEITPERMKRWSQSKTNTE